MTTSRFTALLPVLVAAFPLTAAGADAGSPPHLLDYHDDRLTVHVQEVPLTEVVTEIARQSGADLRGQVCRPRDVSAAFEGEPLAAALERLLGEQNFTLRYGRDGQLQVIQLLGPPEARAASSTPAAAALRPTPGHPVGVAGMVTADDRQRPGVPHTSSPGRRARTAGGTAKRRQGGPASAEGSPAVLGAFAQQANGVAQQAGADQQPLTGAELAQRMSRTVLNSLQAMDDATLATFQDTPEGRRALALVQFYATHHLGSSQQQKATGIIERLPSPPPPRPGG
ncbi:MAG: hypothetical protein E6J71_13305 [Deltaproteobacteria bacterium]|nr:MAG: hypothetical protein E6J71_13305 [Deltaproteobacteria bacterium]